MRLELVERLQCPADHRPTPLVVVASEVVDRDLRRGTAGCMQCGREARFRAGDLWGASVGAATSSSSESPERREREGTYAVSPSLEALDRLQALLGLAESGGAVLLGGRYAAFAAGLQARLDLMVIVTDPDASLFTSAARVIGWADGVPFTEGTFRAAALDGARLVDAAVRTVRAGGRIVAPLSSPRPSTVTLLATDTAEWVGERGATPSVIPLERAAPR